MSSRLNLNQVLQSFEEDRKKEQEAREIVDSILVYSVLADGKINPSEADIYDKLIQSPFPDNSNLIASEIVNAVIGYVGGDFNKYRYRIDPHVRQANFEKTLAKYFEEQMDLYGEELHPLIPESMIFLTKPEIITPGGPDRPYTRSPLVSYLHALHRDGQLHRITFDYIWHFSPEFFRRTMTEIIPEFDDDLLENVESIGSIMREHVKRDLPKWRETCREMAVLLATNEFP